MAKYLKQYRYFGDNNTDNYPSGLEGITQDKLISGSIFFDGNNLHSISELGIQAYPGTKFFLNDSTDYILIGSSGRYELSLSENYEITTLRFDEDSIRNAPWDSSAYLIVDVVYNGTGE